MRRGPGATILVEILVGCPQICTLTARQIASLAGLAPMTRQSGQWRGKAFIQAARKFLRDALCMPALVAARCNPDLCRKYETMTQAGNPASGFSLNRVQLSRSGRLSCRMSWAKNRFPPFRDMLSKSL